MQLDGAPAVEAVVPATALRELDLRPGRQLWASVDAARVQVYA
ncbi:MAG: TOBE domain-containing protein [Frankiaceae bacterium]|nr:TOBE domain-containing protein [Frankiaceae bacterium]